MNKGEGTLGKLANDQSLYNNLDSLAVNMSNLLKNMQEEPRRYTRGLIKIF
jgi:phospholipid/cholesterol/gamma-HCH transport system substrate-binding protein